MKGSTDRDWLQLQTLALSGTFPWGTNQATSAVAVNIIPHASLRRLHKSSAQQSVHPANFPLWLSFNSVDRKQLGTAICTRSGALGWWQHNTLSMISKFDCSAFSYWAWWGSASNPPPSSHWEMGENLSSCRCNLAMSLSCTSSVLEASASTCSTSATRSGCLESASDICKITLPRSVINLEVSSWMHMAHLTNMKGWSELNWGYNKTGTLISSCFSSSNPIWHSMDQ